MTARSTHINFQRYVEGQTQVFPQSVAVPPLDGLIRKI